MKKKEKVGKKKEKEGDNFRNKGIYRLVSYQLEVCGIDGIFIEQMEGNVI